MTFGLIRRPSDQKRVDPVAALITAQVATTKVLEGEKLMSDPQLKLESKSFKIPTPVSTTSELPTDPQLQKIAGDVLTELKYSFAAAAADTEMLKQGRADAVFRNFLATRNSTKRAK